MSGACLMVRRTAFEAVGGMDERFFMYWEDADFCFRLKRAGWLTFYNPIVARHAPHGPQQLTGAEGLVDRVPSQCVSLLSQTRRPGRARRRARRVPHAARRDCFSSSRRWS